METEYDMVVRELTEACDGVPPTWRDKGKGSVRLKWNHFHRDDDEAAGYAKRIELRRKALVDKAKELGLKNVTRYPVSGYDDGHITIRYEGLPLRTPPSTGFKQLDALLLQWKVMLCDNHDGKNHYPSIKQERGDKELRIIFTPSSRPNSMKKTEADVNVKVTADDMEDRGYQVIWRATYKPRPIAIRVDKFIYSLQVLITNEQLEGLQ